MITEIVNNFETTKNWNEIIVNNRTSIMVNWLPILWTD